MIMWRRWSTAMGVWKLAAIGSPTICEHCRKQNLGQVYGLSAWLKENTKKQVNSLRKSVFSSTLFRLLLKPLPMRRGGIGGLRISCIGGWMSYFEKMPAAFARETL